MTGAGGLIGNSLIQIAPEHAAGWTVVGLTRSRLDLTDFTAVRAAFAADQPQLVIPCAAISRSTDGEAESARARQVNADVTTRLSELATGKREILRSHRRGCPGANRSKRGC